MSTASVHHVVGLSALLALSIGCGHQATPNLSLSAIDMGKPVVSNPVVAKKRLPSPARVSKRPANKEGVVFVAEYHNIGTDKSNMFRSPEQFKKDLQRFYDFGFRPVTASEYLDNKMSLPPGASPVVITFDDSQPSQIKLRADGSLDPDCAMGIWESFAKDHPDFPMKATFFVLPRMWDQPLLRKQKIALVHKWGSELANHTVHHPVLRNLPDEKVKQEIAGGCEMLEHFGEKGPFLFAMPYGSTPKNRSLIKMFKYHGRVYKIKAAFLVGANPAPSPISKAFNYSRIPRIIAQSGPWGLDDWFSRLEKKEVKPYVAP